MCTTTKPITTYAGLRRNGSTRRQIEASLDACDLVRLRRGVYAHVGACTPVTDAARHGGAVACVTAARHHGLWVLDEGEDVHVWMHAHGRPHRHDPCSCVAHWDDESTADAFGIPSVPRVLVQILACRGVEEFFVVLESALRQGKISPKQLRWLRAHVNHEGREAIAFSRSTSDSGLESLVRWRLRAHGLEVRAQVRITSVGVVDLLVGERLIIEADGKPNHDDSSHRHKDLVRDAHASTWGYITLRFDYAMIVHDWETVELAILSVIDRGLHLTH